MSETLEQTAEKLYQYKSENPPYTIITPKAKIEGFIEGAKWQIGKQDNFIIGFLEFIGGTYSYSNIFNYWYLHADTSKTYTKKELLKKYIDTLNGN